MSSKNINILLSLQDKFSKPLKATTAETKAAQKQIRACSNVINGWATNANSRFKKVTGTVGKVALALGTLGGAISVAGIKAWAGEAIEGFNAAHEAETKLEAVLGNVPSVIAKGAGAAAAAKDHLVALTDKMEETGVIAGDISVAGLQQLATFQLTEESLSKLAPGMADLVAQQKGLNATQSDAVSIGNLVGKAMTGQTGALSKAGIIMTQYQSNVMKTGTEQERAAMLAQILQDNVGGVNKALAKTDAGKILVTKNLLGRAQDEIGEKLMGIKAETYAFVSQYIPKIQNAVMAVIDAAQPKIQAAIAYLKAHRQQITDGLNKVKAVLTTVFNAVSTVVTWAVKHMNILIPVLAGVVAGFLAFNTIMTVISMIKTLTTVIQGISVAGGILNAVMAANPVILIAAAIAALITAGILLYKNWDTIKAKAIELWGKIKEVFSGIRDAIVGAFDSVKNAVKSVFEWIGEKLSWLGDKIEGIPVLGDLIKGVKVVAGTVSKKVTGHATGTSYFSGGLTRINEGGRGEIVQLPGGTQIIPHDVSQKAASVGKNNIIVYVTVQGNVIGNRAFMEQTGEYVGEKVLAALGRV